MKPKKLYYSIALIFVIFAVAAMGCSQKDVTAAEELSKKDKADKKSPANNDLIVEVNGVKLTNAELQTDLNSKLAPLAAQLPADRLEQFKSQMRDKFIDNFIVRTVLAQAADKQNISATDPEIDSKIQEIEKTMPAGMTLENALKTNGMTIDQMRSDIAFGLKTNKLIDSQEKTDSAPSGEEIKKYYDDNKKKFDEPETAHARHILIKTAADDEEKIKTEKKKKIEDLRQKLVKGADFAAIAKEHSDCPSGKKGGDLGTFSRGKMVKPFEEAAFSQKVNEIGPVIETKFGYHIIQTLEHNQARTKSLDDAKGRIKETLKNRKKQQALKSYITQLREKATIVYGKSVN